MLLPTGAPAQTIGTGQQMELSWSDAVADIDSAPPTLFDFIDIVKVDAAVTKNELNITFQLASISADWNRPLGAEYWIEATYHGETFHFVTEYIGNQTTGVYPPGGRPETSSSIWIKQGTEWQRLEDHPGKSSRVANTLSSSYSLSDILADTYPQPGETLQITRIQSYWQSSGSYWHPTGSPAAFATFYQDVVEVSSTDALTIPGQTSTLATLTTPQPTRYSNGEATTYHWPIDLINKDSKVRDFKISIDAGKDVTVRAPSTVVVPKAETRSFDVYVTVPFFHGHGAQREVNVQASSPGLEIQIPLVIHYVDIPQPAGHHNQLYLHGGAPSSFGITNELWMNTNQTGSLVEMRGRSGSCYTSDDDSEGGIAWTFPLQPGLILGLDGRPGETIQFDFTAKVHTPFPGGNFYANLVVMSENEQRELAGFNIIDRPSAQIPLTSTTSTYPVRLEWPLPEELDRVPLTQDTNLILELLFCSANDVPNEQFLTAAIGGQSPAPTISISSGATITLPLNEYRDILQFGTEALSSWTVASPNIAIPPGGTGYWRLIVEKQVTDPAIFGLSAEYATIERVLPTKDSTEVIVSIKAPANSRQGDLYEFVVISDKNHISGDAIRLTAEVRDSAPDQASELNAILGGAKNSPATSSIPLLLSMFGVLLILNHNTRRRD